MTKVLRPAVSGPRPGLLAVARRTRYTASPRPETGFQEPSLLSLSALEIVYCFAVIVFAYALRGGTGFGAVLVMPLLALVIPMKALVPVWSILSVVAGASILRHDYRHIAWGDFLLLMPTCMLGVAFELYFYKLFELAIARARPRRAGGDLRRIVAARRAGACAHLAPAS